MLITLSKRFEFAASRRLYHPDFTEYKNNNTYGPGSGSEHGYGGNFTAFVVFSGPVDEKTGMIINVTDIKSEVNKVLSKGYDHKFLNKDNPAYIEKVPTLENIAVTLLSDLKKRFENHSATLAACHLVESDEAEVTVYSDGRVERRYITSFSSARRTRSPNLTDDENNQLFGEATNIHGHHYRLIVTVEDKLDSKTGLLHSHDQTIDAVRHVRTKFDHKFLNEDIPELKQIPVTTESLTRFMFRLIPNAKRVQLWENDWFGMEYSETSGFKMMLKSVFRAAHRLHSLSLSDKENLEVYGKCNNPAGHGHDYQVEVTIGSDLDERSGTMADLLKVKNQFDAVLYEFDYKHLDIEIDDFKDKPSTGENIIKLIFEKCQAAMGDDVSRLRIWETPNNRFTIRKES